MTAEETEGLAESETDSGMKRESILHVANLPFLLVAAITAFIVLVNSPWWTVQSVASGSILSVEVSPFYVHIAALGVSSTVPYAVELGTASRILLGITTVALLWQAFLPLSMWRKPVAWLSLSSLAEMFFSFALMLQSTQILLLNQYGIIPPLSGASSIPGVVLGLDFSAYSNPALLSSLGPSLFLGLSCTVILGGSELAQFLLNPKVGLFPLQFLKGLSGAFLSPPYQRALLTSSDQSFNPLNQDPDNLTDDELALSFDRLLDSMEPGGLVSIILPAWATRLSNRLVRVVPWTGFRLENSQMVYRIPGRAENELVFRKPDLIPPEEEVREPLPPELEEPVREEPSVQPEPEPVEMENPAVEENEEPALAEPEISREEQAMVESALMVIERTGEPVGYMELINQVYMDLIDKRIHFESAYEIEATLLQHLEKELAILEESDESGKGIVRRWWFGEETQKQVKLGRRLRARLSDVKKRVPNVRGLLEKHVPRRKRQRPERQVHEDAELENLENELDPAELTDG